MKTLPILATLALLLGCGESEEALTGGRFKTEINGTPITIELDPGIGRFSGQAVNRFFGSYEIADGKITFSQVASSMMMDLPDAMEAEDKFFKFLPQVESYSMKNGKLVLKAPSGTTMKFTRVAP